MRFSIVTPSYKNGKWLQLCIPSVADQGKDILLEHIVQDSCSDDETPEILARHPHVTAVIEKDRSMYDAVNRGFAKARGEFLAYLNCDEQYLPGTLRKVAAFFDANPKVDILFCDTLIVGKNGDYRCFRRATPPRLAQSWIGNSLNTLTAATFARRSVFHERKLRFSDSLRYLGDVVWTCDMLRAGIPFAIRNEFTTIFTQTGENMSLKDNARREKAELLARAPFWMRAARPLILAHNRLLRILHGAYRCDPHDYSIYSLDSPTQRKTFHVSHPTARWDHRG